MNEVRPIFIEAYACNDYSDSPTCVTIEPNDAFWKRVAELATLCQTHNIRAEASAAQFVRGWAISDQDEDMIMGCAVMSVFNDEEGPCVVFRAYPKHEDYACESRRMNISELFEKVRKGTRAFGENGSYLNARIEALAQQGIDL